MKKFKYILPIASIALVGLSPLTTLSSCQNRKKVFPEIYRCEQLTPTLYCLDQNKTTGVIFYKDCGGNDFPIYLINNSHIPYIEVKSYLKMMFSEYDMGITTNDGITTITSYLAQGIPYGEAKCIIDFEKQTITFHHYDAWRNHYYFNDGPLLDGCNGAYNYFSKVTLDKYVYGGPLVIDLKKYNMVGYYTEENHSFLPMELITNIFGLEWNYPLHWNGNGLYERITGNVDLLVNVQKYVREHAAENFYNEEYMQYCYDLLALTLDFHYGLTERESRVNPGTKIKYLENGAYSILNSYHDRLVSAELDVSSEAYLEVFRTLLDDGGHTYYGGINALSSKTFDFSESIGKESAYTNKVYFDMTNARNATGNVNPVKYWLNEKSATQEWIDEWEVDSYYKEYETEKGTIAYITFDSFRGSVWDYSEKEKKEQEGSFFNPRALQKYTTEENSVHSTIRMTLWADQQIKDHNIKNVVIDLSCNGGGAVYAEHFIASWLCGSVKEKIYNPVSKSYSEYTVYADIDNDGKFDSKDYLPSDVNLYVITSPFSFSCANLLACNIQDNRPENTYFIGAPAGGGACFVQDILTTGLNNDYQISSTFHMLRKDSTYKNKISVDSGNNITDKWAIDPDTQISDYFDRDKLNKRILE